MQAPLQPSRIACMHGGVVLKCVGVKNDGIEHAAVLVPTEEIK